MKNHQDSFFWFSDFPFVDEDKRHVCLLACVCACVDVCARTCIRLGRGRGGVSSRMRIFLSMPVSLTFNSVFLKELKIKGIGPCLELGRPTVVNGVKWEEGNLGVLRWHWELTANAPRGKSCPLKRNFILGLKSSVACLS